MSATFTRHDKAQEALLALEEAKRELLKKRIDPGNRKTYEMVVAEGISERLPDLIEERWRLCSVCCSGCDRHVAAVAVIRIPVREKPAAVPLCRDCLTKALLLVPEPVEERPWNFFERRAGR